MKSPQILLTVLCVSALSTPVLAQQVPQVDDETADLREQIRLLEERQESLEQELEELRQLLNNQADAPLESPSGESLSESVVAASDEQQPMGLDISLGVVNFKPRTSNLQDFAIVDPGTALVVGGDLARVDYRETQAFRYGANIRFEGSAVDVGFSNVTYASDGSASAVAPANGFLFATLAHPAQNERAATASAISSLRYSTTDLDIGYSFDIGSLVEARLISGLRFTDMNQTMTVLYDGIDFTNTEISVNRSFSGTGLHLGGEANLNLGSGFSLFGQVDGALLLGNVSLNQREVDNNGLDEIASLQQPGDSRVIPMLELAAGLNWTGNLSESSRVNLSLGYMMERWFGVLDDVRFVDSSGTGVISQEPTDISSEGMFVELGVQFDF